MIEQIIAWIILAAFSPVVLLAMFEVNSGNGFWRDYKMAVVAIIAIAASFSGILALVWAVTVVFK